MSLSRSMPLLHTVHRWRWETPTPSTSFSENECGRLPSCAVGGIDYSIMLSLRIGSRWGSVMGSRRGYSGQAGGIQQFYDTVTKPGERPVAGRSWRASELRLKSFSDLHKLWFVLVKEKNMLLTERLAARTTAPRGSVLFKNPLRLRKVKLSMARIQVVLSERQRVHAETVANIRLMYLKHHRQIKAQRAATTSNTTPTTTSS
jgi:ribosomal protein L29